ncbi:MAG: GAF domain-containing protein [Desulfarculus sp.]|nr:MAG: GAF domain-containing protein [Desulfarculus sp.]
MDPAEASPLAPDQERILSLAALFEGGFNIDWLVAICDDRVSNILAALAEGQRRGWLAAQSPESYQFSDPAERQAFLGRLGTAERDALLRRIARLLITELPDENSKAQVLAPYLLCLDNDVEGCRWLVRSGDQQRRAFAVERAVQLYSKALEDLAHLPGEEADRLYTASAIKYSKISTARHDTRRVVSILQTAMERAQALRERGYQSLLEMHLAKNQWLLSHYSRALRHFERGWSLAKEVGDPELLRAATTFSMFFLYWQGRFAEAVKSYEKAVPDVERVQQVRFNRFAALTMGVCYAQTGQVSQGLGMMNAIRNQSRELGDFYLAAQAECAMGAALLDIRRTPEALGYLEKVVHRRASQHHNEWMLIMGKLMIAYAHFLEGRHRRSLHYLRQFLTRSRQVHVTVKPYPYLMALLWAMEQGELPRLPEMSLEDEIQRVLKGHNVFMKGLALRHQALLGQHRGQDPAAGLEPLHQSLHWLGLSGCLLEQARSRLELARLLGSLAREEEAQAQTAAAQDILAGLNQEMIPEDMRPLLPRQPEGRKQLGEILRLSQELVTLRDHKDVVQHIFSAVNRLTGAERGAIFLWDQEDGQRRLTLRASKNLTQEQVEQAGFAASRQMIGEVAASGQGRLLERENGPEEVAGEVIHSCICVPMILRDQVVGVLYHDNRLLKAAFKESDLELLAHFATQAAIAMDNARAYEEIRRLNQKLKQEKAYYQEETRQHLHFEEFVGDSPAIMRVLAQVEQVAATDTTVLILGETGVGKELVARAIHRHSQRAQKPFIRVLCNTLPDSLIPSELFGHERGAFTGATRRRIGRFELADGGTIFLDEIGELPLEVQVRLLRVLQTREFERVGGSETLRSDFRLVTATNRDLEQEVKAGRLRMDLYYRLNVFPIRVPPLRERKEDIPALAQFFLQSYANKMGKEFGAIPPEELDKLMRYDWPGNVRELENVIERACILSRGPRLQVPERVVPALQGTGDRPTLQAVERAHILWALQQTGWKVRGQGGAAELLDIHPSTLAYRLKKLGIERPRRSRRGGPEEPDPSPGSAGWPEQPLA